ncbi:methyltransferase domain-containing protein [Candidatus Woesearchaeota archaeon]|jgi:SAM-dependent methyltransferase|nr:methyltransferase domain-containing protein [Candidatus Woesearchaeota archaeon]MBT6044743.1 methyltransferase domain-containing protein [Candidatus Woesearchaeota archaeon]
MEKKSNVRKLEIGCGSKKQKGFFGIDLYPYAGVDLVIDVDNGLPFKNNTIEEIYTEHALEHVKEFEFVMEEIYRICKPKAKIVIKVPYFSGKSAFFEFHRRFFRYDSFTDFEQDEKSMLTTKNPVNFKVKKRKLIFLKKWYLPWNFIIEPLFNIHQKICLFYEETFLRNLFPAYEMYFELEAKK